MIRPQPITAKLADKVILNDKFIHYYFELVNPHQFEFYAGQYISLAVSPEGHRRSYSICSEPSKQHGFELLVDVTPQGEGTKFLDNLQFGQEVSALAPLGMFTVPENSDEEVLAFIATGSGVAPFRSMVLDQLHAKQEKRPIILYWGMRHVEQLFWLEEFEELMKSFSNFQFHPVISQALPEWPMCRGRVTDCLSVHQQQANTGYYLCGNTHMITDVLALLGQQGVMSNHIHHEKFY